VILATLTVILGNIVVVDGFLTPPMTTSSYPPKTDVVDSSGSGSSSTTRLLDASSSFDDDELSKLIGKRAQIKRKKKEELPNEDDVFDAIKEEIADEDLDRMPEFQTKRPVREPKTKNDEAQDEYNSSSSRSSLNEPTYVDFLSDYEDENDFHIPNRIGVSTVAWGDETRGFVPSGKLKKQQLREGKFVPGDLQMAYDALVEGGILLFETSPAYGKNMATKQLSAEAILARCMQENPTKVPLVMDTFAGPVWRRRAGAVTDALSSSCDTLGVPAVDVYQARHVGGWILPSGGILRGMAEAVIDQGTANHVGVQDVAPRRLRRLVSRLDRRGLTVTTDAFEFSLTNRRREGWIAACKALGVVPLCRDPLGGGLASGQYTATNPSGGLASSGASRYSFALLEKLQPLHSVLDSVAERVKTRLQRENRDIQDRYRGRKGPPVSAPSSWCAEKRIFAVT
jgi:aryl-alcohol dehydrogenase-like predicted oxidoreductase